MFAQKGLSSIKLTILLFRCRYENYYFYFTVTSELRSGNEVRRIFLLRFSTAANDFGCVSDVILIVFDVFDDVFVGFSDF